MNQNLLWIAGLVALILIASILTIRKASRRRLFLRVKPKGIRPPSLQVEPEKFQLTVINDSGKPQTFELRNHNGTVKAIMEINPGRTAIVGLNLPLDEYQLLAVDPKTLIHVNKSTLTFQTVAGSSTRNQGLRP